MEAVILAGGKGTRIQTVAGDRPKALVPVLGVPVIFRLIDWLVDQGVHKVTVLAGFKSDQVSAALSIRYGSFVSVISEPSPLGTGGALSLLKGKVENDFLLVSGDLLAKVNLATLRRFHGDKQSLVTITTHSNTNPKDGDLIEVGSEHRVTQILNRPHPTSLLYLNNVNAAISVISPRIFTYIPDQVFLNFEKDVMTKALVAGESIFAHRTVEYIKDMGTVERLAEAESDLSSNLPELKYGVRDVSNTFIVNLSTYIDAETIDKPEILDPFVCLKLQDVVATKACLIGVLPRCSRLTQAQTKIYLETQLGNHKLKFDEILICEKDHRVDSAGSPWWESIFAPPHLEGTNWSSLKVV